MDHVISHVILHMSCTVLSSAAEASGRRFYYLTGAAALLELALLQYAMHKAVSKVGRHTHTHSETSLMIHSAGVYPCHYTRYCQDWSSGELFFIFTTAVSPLLHSRRRGVASIHEERLHKYIHYIITMETYHCLAQQKFP